MLLCCTPWAWHVTAGSRRAPLWLRCLWGAALRSDSWLLRKTISEDVLALWVCWKRYCRACLRKEEQREKCKFKRDDADCRVRSSTETEILLDTQKVRQHNIKWKLINPLIYILMDLRLWNRCCGRERCHYINSGRSRTQLQRSGLLLFFHYAFSGQLEEMKQPKKAWQGPVHLCHFNN